MPEPESNNRGLTPADSARLLVHACCAPCSTVALERLRQQWRLAFFFYGPNIHPDAEYRLRLEEMRRFCRKQGVQLLEGEYRPADWGRAILPWRHLKEGSRRCQECFRLRMRRTAAEARQRGFAAFSVTLTVSRHKNSRLVIETGRQVAEESGVPFVDIDLKKRAGYERSLELSRQWGFYRQNYCGCSLSRSEALARRRRRAGT